MDMYDFIRPMLAEAIADGAFPSAVAAVGCGGTVYGRFAAGDARLGTRFDIASMSKIFGPTMLALQAIDRGDLTLYDPLARFFPDAPADKAAITVLQLMTHSGGFEPTFYLEDEIDDPVDAARCILRHPLAAPPDGTPRYSCMGYILLGKLLERLYGAPLDVLAKAHVFGPLGMADTAYCPTGADIAPTEVDPATGAAWCGTVHDENARFLRGVSGNAGVFTTLEDAIRLVSTLARGGDGFLSPAVMRRATQNHTPGHDAHRGLGFHLGGTPASFMGDLFPADSFGHTGFTGTCFAVDPHTGFYAILLTNHVHPKRGGEKLFRFRRAFHNRVYAAFTREHQRPDGLGCR